MSEAWKANLGFLEVCLQNPGQHLLQDSLGFQPFVFLAAKGEAAGEHAVEQDATRPDVRHLAGILVVQQHLWCHILRSACTFIIILFCRYCRRNCVMTCSHYVVGCTITVIADTEPPSELLSKF